MLLILFSVCEWFVKCLSACVCVMPMVVIRGCGIPRNWHFIQMVGSYQLVTGTEPRVLCKNP